MPTSRVELREADQPTLHRMPREVAAGLVEARIASVAPTFAADEYRVSSVQKVGVVRIAGHDVWIRPKTPVRRLFAMLGYARAGSRIWQEDDFGFEADEDLVPALAYAFERQASRALAGGALRGYVTREDALPLVRGRWRIGDQLTRRGGQPLPVEVSFDDYAEDIAENQLVLTAATRLLRLPGVPADVAGRLRRVVRVLDGASVIPVGAPVPVVRSDRRNARYAGVLPLASLVLAGASIEQRAGALVGAGFLVDMWSVFEDFVTAALQEAFRPYGGELVAQYASTLDVEGRVRIAPDLVWLVDGEVRACIDVKYKVEKHGQYPNADLYQMAAYCRRFGLGEGWLVYAHGGADAEPVRLIDGPCVRRHPIEVRSHWMTVLESVAAVAAVAAGVSMRGAVPLTARHCYGADMVNEGLREELRAFVAEREWQQFHSPDNLAKSVAIEAGELLECFQWSSSGDDARVREELADVLTYCYLLADRLGADPEQLIRDKLVVTRHKYPVDRARGRSARYDEL